MNDDEPRRSGPFGERNGSAKKHADILPDHTRATVDALEYTDAIGASETLVGVRESWGLMRERGSPNTPRSGPITRVR